MNEITVEYTSGIEAVNEFQRRWVEHVAAQLELAVEIAPTLKALLTKAKADHFILREWCHENLPFTYEWALKLIAVGEHPEVLKLFEPVGIEQAYILCNVVKKVGVKDEANIPENKRKVIERKFREKVETRNVKRRRPGKDKLKSILNKEDTKALVQMMQRFRITGSVVNLSHLLVQIVPLTTLQQMLRQDIPTDAREAQATFHDVAEKVAELPQPAS